MPAPPPPEETRWKPGQPSPNPGGKPKGARNRLQGAFLNALADDFDVHGKKAIEDARKEDPMGYVKAVAALMPKQVEQSQPLDDLTDAELLAGIAFLRSRLAEPAGKGMGAPTELQ
ncbi:MAG TPA: DUF5681 domain-containing protein [Acidobacteriaceae bacterium]